MFGNRQGKTMIKLFRYIFCTALIVLMGGAGITLKAQVREEQADTVTFRDMWSVRTNALEWLLTIPNIGVEFDVSPSVYNRVSVGLNARYNWNTSHNYTTPLVFNVFELRPEVRYYWRQTQKRPKSETDTLSFGQWFKRNIWTTARKNPKEWRAYYIGAYVNGGTYSFKFGKEGRQGQMYGLGVSAGYALPLYQYEKSVIDIEFGFALGLAVTRYDAFGHNQNGDYYYKIDDRSRGFHMVPYPVISELKVAFVYRQKSVEDKYKKVDQKKIQEKMDKMDQRQMYRDSVEKARIQKKLDKDRLAAEKEAQKDEMKESGEKRPLFDSFSKKKAGKEQDEDGEDVPKRKFFDFFSKKKVMEEER